MWTSRLFFLVGCWIVILTLLQLVPFFTALALEEGVAASSFFASMSVGLLVGGSLYMGFRSSERVRIRKLTILLPLVGGVALAFAAGLPFFFLLPDAGLITAFYEGMSLITTTGATAYDGSLSEMRSVQLWRSMAAWFGGFMAVCVSLSLLTALNSGGIQLHRSALPFGDSEKGYPRLKATAVTLWPVYALFTAICCLLLMLGGMPFDSAVMLSMASVSTTGITPDGGHVVVGFWPQLVVVIFTICAALSWDMHYARLKQLRFNIQFTLETRAFTFALVSAAFVLFFLSDEGWMDALWGSIFASVSAVTTSGFASGDSHFSTELPLASAIVLMALVCLGGSVAGTSGGIKMLRGVILGMLGKAEVERLALPHGVRALRYEGQSVQPRDIEAVWLVLGGFVFVFVVGVLTLAIFGIRFQEAIALALSSLALSGPMAFAIDPYFPGFTGMHDKDYIVLSILMLVGRVEASLFLALFAKSLWRG